MTYFLLGAVVGLLAYIAYRLDEVIKRLTILDIRARLEILHLRNPSVVKTYYMTLFNRELNNFDAKTRDKIVHFARHNDFDLPHVLTASEMKDDEENMKKDPSLGVVQR